MIEKNNHESLIPIRLHHQNPLSPGSSLVWSIRYQEGRRKETPGIYFPVSLTANLSLSSGVFLCLRPCAEKQLLYYMYGSLNGIW